MTAHGVTVSTLCPLSDVEVTATFEKQLERFPFVSRTAQQKEMVDVLKAVQRHYDFQTFVDELAGNGQVTVGQLAQIPSTEELFQFAQSVKARKERLGVDGFVAGYYLKRGDSAEDDSERDEEWSDGDQLDDEHSSFSTERGRDSDNAIGHHYDNLNEERYNQIETSSSLKPKKSNHSESTRSHSEEHRVSGHTAGSTVVMGTHRGAGNGTQSAEDEEEQKPIMDEAAGNTILEDHATDDSVSGMERREEAQSAAAGKCICIVL